MSAKHKHHGGAWKVAYADFTTAMMALFIVLWLTSQDQRIKDAVERAFRNPFSSITKESVGVIPNKNMEASREEAGNANMSAIMELKMLRRMNQDLSKSLQASGDDEQSSVKL
jgi:chemotaxis protein MotB